jgi:hypothetical protein
MHDETNRQASSGEDICQSRYPASTPRNRRIVVPPYGGPDVMKVIEEPLPEPGPNRQDESFPRRLTGDSSRSILCEFIAPR